MLDQNLLMFLPLLKGLKKLLVVLLSLIVVVTSVEIWEVLKSPIQVSSSTTKGWYDMVVNRSKMPQQVTKAPGKKKFKNYKEVRPILESSTKKMLDKYYKDLIK